MKRNDTNWLLLLGLALLLGGGGFAVYQMTRGLRNNNPGNLRFSTANNWQGQTGSDGEFAIFSSAILGIRALGKTLLSYVNKDGVAPTVTGIISRWAPSSENDTVSYINDVAGQLSVDPNASLDVPAVLPQLLEAIINHENGLQPYDVATINNGANLAINA